MYIMPVTRVNQDDLHSVIQFALDRVELSKALTFIAVGEPDKTVPRIFLKTLVRVKYLTFLNSVAIYPFLYSFLSGVCCVLSFFYCRPQCVVEANIVIQSD